MTTRFPLLKSQKIYDFLKSSFEKVGTSFHPSLAEIESPTTRSVTRLFAELFELVVGCPMSGQIPFVENLEHPELYQESLMKLTFLKDVRKLVSAAGISPDTISIEDLWSPNRKGLCYILSGIVNFLKFCERYDEDHDEAQGTLNAKEEQLQLLRARKEKLKERVGALKNLRKRDEARRAEIVEENEALGAKVAALNEEQLALVAKRDKMKTEIQENVDMEAHLKVMLMEAKEEIESLSSRVVSSPDRVKDEIEQMKQKQFALVKRRSENDKQIRDMTNSVQFMEEIANQVNAKCFTLMRGVKEREQDRSAQQQMLNDLEEREATLKLDLKKSIGDDEHSRRNVDAMRRRKAQLEAQVDMRMMADKKEKDQYSEELAGLETVKKMNQKRIDELKLESEKLKRELKEDYEGHQRSKEKAKKTLEEAVKEVVAVIHKERDRYVATGQEIEGCKKH
ncbi:uncharacterized protein [Oscarella lobularis]|uniref:uncharacterized protein n=1 Tax=Oscarella lobularis TaxID=121494 RepID=UPI00331387FF